MPLELPQTYRKLREARFFLDRMKGAARPKAFSIHHPSHLALNIAVNAGKSVKLRIDQEQYQFFLSAFLSAARSVTFVLQKEGKATYDRTFPLWRNNLPNEDRELLDLMNEQRTREVHQSEAQVVSGVEATPIHNIDTDASGRITVSSSTPIAPQTITVPKCHFMFAGQRSEITGLCSRYMDLLENFVAKLQ